MKNLKNINLRILKEEITENLNNSSINAKDKYKNTKVNSKFEYSFFYLILIVISTILSILYLPIYLIMDYKLEISIMLITLLSFRYIFNEDNIKNPILRFFIEKSILIIMPLLILFIYVIIFA